MICKKCGCTDIDTTTVMETPKMGIITKIFWVILGCTIIGLAVVIPAMLLQSSRRKKPVTYAVCKKCGHMWVVR